MDTSRRDFLRSAAGVAGGVAVSAQLGEHAQGASGSLGSSKTVRTRRPNILYINSHDTGRFTSPYGYAVPTPNLQRLASEGVCFSRAFCAAPTCSASRASLLTGQCSHSNGMLGLVNRGFRLNNYQHHILHTLRRESGYYSALVGLQHIAKHSSVIGYDYFENIPGNHVEQVTPAAVRFLQRKPKQPFWLEVGYFETHRPYRQAEIADNPRFLRPPEPIPDVPPTRRDMADFHTSARVLDWGVGEVLAALEAAGLAENTLVISATDHGISFPDMKTCLYDAGAGVHLVMRGPGGFRGGKVCNAMISHVDIFPTICDLLDIELPGWLEGKSFMPVMRGDVKEVNNEIFAELNYHASYEPKRSVRTQRWKYIRHFSDYMHPVLPNCDDSLSKTYWLEHGWGQKIIAREELFDLVFDPNERNNLAGDPAYRSTLSVMQQKLRTWMQKTADPLLKGPVKAPPGAQINPVTEISPEDPTITVS